MNQKRADTGNDPAQSNPGEDLQHHELPTVAYPALKKEKECTGQKAYHQDSAVAHQVAQTSKENGGQGRSTHGDPDGQPGEAVHAFCVGDQSH